MDDDTAPSHVIRNLFIMEHRFFAPLPLMKADHEEHILHILYQMGPDEAVKWSRTLLTLPENLRRAALFSHLGFRVLDWERCSYTSREVINQLKNVIVPKKDYKGRTYADFALGSVDALSFLLLEEMKALTTEEEKFLAPSPYCTEENDISDKRRLGMDAYLEQNILINIMDPREDEHPYLKEYAEPKMYEDKLGLAECLPKKDADQGVPYSHDELRGHVKALMYAMYQGCSTGTCKINAKDGFMRLAGAMYRDIKL